jgi:hypothetical protein
MLPMLQVGFDRGSFAMLYAAACADDMQQKCKDSCKAVRCTVDRPWHKCNERRKACVCRQPQILQEWGVSQIAVKAGGRFIEARSQLTVGYSIPQESVAAPDHRDQTLGSCWHLVMWLQH